MEQQKQLALDAIDRAADLLGHNSDSIWDAAELAFHEHESVRIQLDTLNKLGFENIRTNLCDIPTAFSARWGSGKPVIGFLGEFDALSNLSQKPGVAKKDPLVPNGNGHGCGHHLLGTGAMAAAYAAKEYLKNTGKSGTVIYFGCPAEENGSGKAFMARDGAFDELDLSLTWHPGETTHVWSDSTLANFAIKYRFKGVSAHASGAPHLGRSALDAVELMNVGVQFLREHVPTTVRMHYAITDSGGMAPNVVQPNAEVFYLLRAPSVALVQEVYERVNDIARGAALMTGTKETIEFVKCASNMLSNRALNKVLDANLHAVPLPQPTQEELDFAQAIFDSRESYYSPYDEILPRLTFEEQEWTKSQPLDPVCQCVIPAYHDFRPGKASTDVGDASWATPTAQIRVATWPSNISNHTWQATALGKTTLAKKRMLFAGKVLAATAIDLFNDPDTVAAARAEYEKELGGKPFVSPLPKDVKPKL